MRRLWTGPGPHTGLPRYRGPHGGGPSGLRRWNLRLWHRPQSVNILHQRPQYFCHAPGLRDAAARPLWRIAVEDFGDVSYAAIGAMVLEWREPGGSLAAGGFTVSV